VMRLASADLLPFAFTNLASTVQRYSRELQQLRDHRASDIAERTKQVEEGIATALSDPRSPTRALPTEAAPPHLNFAPLQNASDALTAAAARYEKASAKVLDRGGVTMAAGASGAPIDATLRAANIKLVQSERALTAPDGLPKRPWFTHLLYAPGYYTGYGVKTMPGVREAIEQSDWTTAEQQIGRVAAAVQREAAHVNEVADLLERGQKPTP